MKQSLDTRTKLLTQRPFSLMLELSIPAVLGMVVVGLYNMMDSIFVGQMVGDIQMGAVSVDVYKRQAPCNEVAVRRDAIRLMVYICRQLRIRLPLRGN